MKISVRTFLFLIFLLSPLSARASSPLLNLPYGIVIGQTTNEEIEDRGSCINQIKVRDNYFRCKTYSMSGNFAVFSSQNEKVTSLYFGENIGKVGLNNSLPRKWQRLGLKFMDFNGKKDGTLKKDFLKLIKRQGAQDISFKTDPNYDFVEYTTFYLGDYKFEAKIWVGSSTTNGLTGIQVFESF